MNQLTASKQIFLYAAPFPPLLFFKIWISTAGRSVESMICVSSLLFGYCLFTLYLARRWDRPTHFDWAIGGYFLFVLSFLLFRPQTAHNLFTRFATTGVYTTFLLAALVPLMIHKEPFTMHYARKYVSEGVWRNPVFLEINHIMTWVWTGLFLICVLLSLYPSILTRVILPIGLLLGFGLPFNLRFPNYYLKRVGLPTLSELKEMFGPHAEEPETIPETPESQEKTRVQKVSAGVADEAHCVKRVLALNSSPRGGSRSKTQLLLDHLATGMREAGADVTVVNLREKTVKNCVGCFSCWTRTPGECVLRDDMTDELYPLWKASDVVVYASPLYHFGLNAAMKTFVERTLPVMEPFFFEKEGKTSHPYRYTPPRAVMLSVAGFPEKTVFDQLSSWADFVFGRSGLLIVEIYRPFAEALVLPFMKEKAAQIFSALRQAGREIVMDSTVSGSTMVAVTQPFTDDDAGFIRSLGNLMWKSCIDKGITPGEFDAMGGIPRPDSIDSFLMLMQFGFNPRNARRVTATVQFVFTGLVNEDCYFTINANSIRTGRGKAARADLTIESPFDVWMDILTRQTDGQRMFMEQKYKARGDIGLLMGMGEMFAS